MSVPAVFLSQLFVRKCLVFAGGSLLVYDYLITLPLEVQYFWNAPWKAIKAGFLLNRYANLIGQTFIMLEETGYLNDGSAEFCTAFALFCTFFILFCGELIRILVLMRAWAIWGCTYRVTIFLITLYILYFLAMALATIYPQTTPIVSFIQYPYLEQVDVCIMPMFPNVWLAVFATLVLDITVLAMVLHSLRKLTKGSHGLYSSPLIHLLVLDAVLFYMTSLFTNVFGIICWTAFGNDPRTFFEIAFSFPLFSVIGQRLILNLRGFQARPVATCDISREVDRQMAALGDRLWPDLDADVEEVNPERSEDSKTSRMTGMAGPDLELAVTEIPRDQGSPGAVHFLQQPKETEQ